MGSEPDLVRTALALGAKCRNADQFWRRIRRPSAHWLHVPRPQNIGTPRHACVLAKKLYASEWRNLNRVGITVGVATKKGGAHSSSVFFIVGKRG